MANNALTYITSRSERTSYSAHITTAANAVNTTP